MERLIGQGPVRSTVREWIVSFACGAGELLLDLLRRSLMALNPLVELPETPPPAHPDRLPSPARRHRLGRAHRFWQLTENDRATRASLVMLSDIPNIIALSQAGFSPEEAREHFTVTGLGTVRAEDWASPYFAPNGRSKRWKLQKRALTDAYRRRFGEPSRQEIHFLRRQRGDVLLLPEDFEGTDHLLPVDRTNLALAHARARLHPPVPTDRDPH